jgi:hypothetical protein
VTFNPGDHVQIKPLGKPGRVVGAQVTGRAGRLLFLVRYEFEGEVPGAPSRRSETALYLDDELDAL